MRRSRGNQRPQLIDPVDGFQTVRAAIGFFGLIAGSTGAIRSRMHIETDPLRPLNFGLLVCYRILEVFDGLQKPHPRIDWTVMPARFRSFVALLWIAVPVVSPGADLNESTTARAYISPSHQKTSAVDAAGVRHHSRDYSGPPPWEKDRIVTVAPQYPLVERQLRREGEGVATIHIDLNSGYVTNVSMKKSTGHRLLDDATIVALRQWRWKPRRWQEIEIPIRFKMRNQLEPPEPVPAGAKFLPRKAPYESSGFENTIPYDWTRPLSSEYVQALSADLRDQWNGLTYQHVDKLIAETVKVELSITKDGKLHIMTIVSNRDSGGLLTQITKQAIEFAQSRLKPFSPAMVKESGGKIFFPITFQAK
jgi:TonB family protein